MCNGEAQGPAAASCVRGNDLSVGWSDGRWMMNWNGLGRNMSWPNWGTILVLLWRDWGKSRRVSSRISGVPSEIWTEHLQDTNRVDYLRIHVRLLSTVMWHCVVRNNVLPQYSGVVGIATGYGLDDRGIGVRVLVGSRIFSSPRRRDRLWGASNLLYNGYGVSFAGGKAAGAWGQENVDLYIHSPKRLHGVVLN
jgi:hypothetical protein